MEQQSHALPEIQLSSVTHRLIGTPAALAGGQGIWVILWGFLDQSLGQRGLAAPKPHE
jgi:hypothetical protein